MAKVAHTMEERLALIKEISRKFQKKQNRAARFTRQERVSNRASKKKREAESEIHWTDSEAYANKYYGEVAYETTRYDNEWD